MNTNTLILARLTEAEYESIMRAGISYSGATGTGKAARQGYNGLGPYIATYVSELHKALRVLGWTHLRIDIHGSHWTVWKRRIARERTRKP